MAPRDSARHRELTDTACVKRVCRSLNAAASWRMLVHAGIHCQSQPRHTSACCCMLVHATASGAYQYLALRPIACQSVPLHTQVSACCGMFVHASKCTELHAPSCMREAACTERHVLNGMGQSGMRPSGMHRAASSVLRAACSERRSPSGML